MRRIVALVLALFVVALTTRAQAHAMRSGSLRIEASSDGRALVELRQSVDHSGVAVVVPEGCTSAPIDELSSDRVQTLSVQCDGSIEGRVFGLRGLGPILEDATLFVRFADGRTAAHLLTRDAPTWALPNAQNPWEIAKSYVRLGVVHIATGADHLAFLALLVLLLRRPRAVLVAESAFTVSHSLSFTATALGWVHVPSSAAEACIAFSLLLLALDVPLRGEAPPSARRGAWMAFVFGLVHGLGFAGGLRELGVPDRHVALAMLGFAGGVELGQIAFLALVLVAVHLVARVRLEPQLRRASVHVLGALSSFWLIERVVVCFGG